MDWNQPLFEAFMIAVVGNLFVISTVLIWSPRKSKIKAERRQEGKRNPICNLCYCPYRMESDFEEQVYEKDSQADCKTDQNLTRKGE